ncbi:MAG: hypothetical protein U0228_34980 [Myxococcaceae bacterium]
MRALVLFVALSLVGCGASEGSPCQTPNALQCASATSVLACEGTTWKAYPCPSCTGSTCNWKNAANGASCPFAAAGDGWCNFDNRQMSCYWSSLADAGVFVESACSGCTAGKSLAEVGKCSGGKCSCN